MSGRDAGDRIRQLVADAGLADLLSAREVDLQRLVLLARLDQLEQDVAVCRQAARRGSSAASCMVAVAKSEEELRAQLG